MKVGNRGIVREIMYSDLAKTKQEFVRIEGFDGAHHVSFLGLVTECGVIPEMKEPEVFKKYHVNGHTLFNDLESAKKYAERMGKTVILEVSNVLSYKTNPEWVSSEKA